MENYYWDTDEPHATNSITLCDYIDNHMDESWKVVFYDGSMACVEVSPGVQYYVHAGGNGDFNNHVVRFERVED